MTERRITDIGDGIVLIDNSRLWHFYASTGFTGDHEKVIEEAEKKGEHNIYICRSSENVFRLEAVEGDVNKVARNETAILIGPEVLSLKEKEIDVFNTDLFHWDLVVGIAPEGGETLAHRIVKSARNMSEEERKKIPFHLFSYEILAMEDSAGFSVALMMALEGVFPPEMINEKVIDIDPNGRILFHLYDYEDYREYIIRNFFTRERLINSGNGWGDNLAYWTVVDGTLPEKYTYEPEILEKYSSRGDPLLNAIIANKPDFVRNFPVESMTAEQLEDLMNTKIFWNENEETFKAVLVAKDKYPKDEITAIFWLIEKDDQKRRVAELYYEIEFPELSRENVQAIREVHLNYFKNECLFLEPGDIL
ncbi:MAG: hypothetical protein EOM62_15990 [Bacteroidia bacterium]|nr:hypothetical protein [Bacteroidia bacterium]